MTTAIVLSIIGAFLGVVLSRLRDLSFLQGQIVASVLVCVVFLACKLVPVYAEHFRALRDAQDLATLPAYEFKDGVKRLLATKHYKRIDQKAFVRAAPEGGGKKVVRLRYEVRVDLDPDLWLEIAFDSPVGGPMPWESKSEVASTK